jgi:hypothetical protein
MDYKKNNITTTNQNGKIKPTTFEFDSVNKLTVHHFGRYTNVVLPLPCCTGFRDPLVTLALLFPALLFA